MPKADADARQMGRIPMPTREPVPEPEPVQPPAPEPEPAKPFLFKPNLNRFDQIFTAVIFNAARADAKVWTDEKTLVKSRKLATVRIEVLGSGGYLHASIKAEQGPRQDKPSARFTFKSTQFESSFTASDPAVASELEQWKRAVERRYKLWRAENPALAMQAGPDTVELDDITL